MFAARRRQIAVALVLGLVFTSLPARVWLFGACPICGQIHVPVLVVTLGSTPSDSLPDSESSKHPHDGDILHTCCPPLPYFPNVPLDHTPDHAAVVGDVRPESDPLIASLPAVALIRPPRA